MSKLNVSGAVARSLEMDHQSFRAINRSVSLSDRVPGREGEALELGDFLTHVKADEGAEFLVFTSEDGFSACVSRQGLDRALLLFGHDLDSLPKKHGGPFRFMIPESVACGSGDHDHCANVKFLASIEIRHERVTDSRC